jgi:catecholate siderophore receptor
MQRVIRARLGFVSIAAILCVTGVARIYAQPAPGGDQATPQQSPTAAQPDTTPPAGAPSPQPSVPPAEQNVPAAQQATTPPPASGSSGERLPTIRIGAARTKPKPKPRPVQVVQPAPATSAALAAPDTQDSRTGTVGIYANSTSIATKVNTPLVNIPQSVNVATKEYIKDQGFQSVTDITRYVPGVDIHQGEGNRDELVIRGVDSSANFFVNGFRDDVQIFRDLYNAQSVEVLKGPSALTFGRGAGGGLVNRTLKEADWSNVKEVTGQTGSYFDRRTTIDLDQAINQQLAVRLNGVYEKSDTFRQYGWLERYGINPTLTYKPDEATKIKLSFESFHDHRTADRGNPSIAFAPLPLTGPSAAANAALLRANPALPYAPNGDLTAFYGSPSLNVARTDVNTAMAFIEHDFDNGLTGKNSTLIADYKKFYQNVYPGNGTLAGQVDPTTGMFNRAAYNHETDRLNLINQTDFVYKTVTGPLNHTLAFGTEFDRQTGIDYRNTGIFPNGLNTIAANASDPTYLGTVEFVHHFTGTNTDGVTAADSNSKYEATAQSAYLRDTVDFTKYLQLIGGLRVDRFHENALDQNTNIDRDRVDTMLSPSAAVIVKPMENMSLYYTYMVSYLPASGDQFSALNPSTVILTPQKFVNNEVGFKWNITPKLLYTAAVYQLDRTGVPVTDPTNPAFQIPNGTHKIQGFETELTGYVTDAWQSKMGYAYTNARIANDLSATIVAGNVVQLVPLHQVAWWNKYQLTPQWAASLGMIYFSDSYASSDDTVKLPAFVRFDAGVFYTINKTWRAQLNVENIFNKGYWASADGNNNISPGQPRTFRLSATAKF